MRSRAPSRAARAGTATDPRVHPRPDRRPDHLAAQKAADGHGRAGLDGRRLTWTPTATRARSIVATKTRAATVPIGTETDRLTTREALRRESVGRPLHHQQHHRHSQTGQPARYTTIAPPDTNGPTSIAGPLLYLAVFIGLKWCARRDSNARPPV